MRQTFVLEHEQVTIAEAGLPQDCWLVTLAGPEAANVMCEGV